MTSLLKNRFMWGALSGIVIGSLLGSPQQIIAQTRTSLSSLQSTIDQLISGHVPVGNSAKLGGYTASDFALTTEAHDASQLQGVIPHSVLPSTLHSISLQSPIILSSSQPANSSTVGMLRFDPNTSQLQVSDGTQWRSLAYATPLQSQTQQTKTQRRTTR